jgi:HPt (histidine-containing phosphotransfer) domain-containing protein
MNYDLSELRTFSRGDLAFELDMIETFLEEADEYSQIIREGFRQKDFPIVGSTAHRFKSSVNLFGMKPLNVILNDIELACKTGQDETLLSRLVGEYNEMINPIIEMMDLEKAKYESIITSNNNNEKKDSRN